MPLFPRKPNSLLVAGVDPGTEFAGLGLAQMALDDSWFEWINLYLIDGKGERVPERLATIEQQFEGLLAYYQPDLLVYEGAFVQGKNVSAGLSVASAIGALLPHFTRHTRRAYEAKPSSLRALIGCSTANYEGLRLALRGAYPELDEPLAQFEWRTVTRGRNAGERVKVYAMSDDQVSAGVQTHAARILVREGLDEIRHKGVFLKWEVPVIKPPRARKTEKKADDPLATSIQAYL